MAKPIVLEDIMFNNDEEEENMKGELREYLVKKESTTFARNVPYSEGTWSSYKVCCPGENSVAIYTGFLNNEYIPHGIGTMTRGNYLITGHFYHGVPNGKFTITKISTGEKAECNLLYNIPYY